jgi:type I restriction enzyme S subunit
MSFKLSIGKMARAGSDLYTNEAIAAFEPLSEELDSNYLFHALPGVLGDLVVDQAVKGATLNKKKLAKISLPLPQRPEQARIAEVLDTLDEATATSARELEKLTRLREGMISEQLGELGRQSVEVVTLADLCRASGGSIQTGPFGSQLHAGDYESEGTPIITVEHLGDGRILHTNLPLVGEPDRIRLQRYSLRVGDLVFSRVGAIDRCAMVRDAEDRWLFSGRLLRVRAASEQVNPAYLSLFLNSEKARRWIRNHAVGSTMACLNTKILGGTPVALPARPLQDTIVAVMAGVDDEIEKERHQIEKLKLIKFGLSSDLLAGRVRISS